MRHKVCDGLEVVVAPAAAGGQARVLIKILKNIRKNETVIVLWYVPVIFFDVSGE